MKHEIEMGGQPLHESDGTVIGTMTDTHGYAHELRECKFCGVKMSRPLPRSATDTRLAAADQVIALARRLRRGREIRA
jgi:hypothetical protein